MKDFISRNLPVFIIGLVTIGVFLLIIFVAQKNPATGPQLKNIENEKLQAEYTPTIGDIESPVKLFEFSDFECPACKAFHPTVKALIEKYQGSVLFGFKHFPLPIHSNAKLAAVASQAAHAQGKFWEYQDKLFEISPNLSREDLIAAAEDIKLDMEKFVKDFDDPKNTTDVESDNAQALRLGLNATPSFVLNNRLVQLTAYEDLEREIRDELIRNNVSLDEIDKNTEGTPTAPESTTSVNKVRTPDQIAIDNAYGTLEIIYDGVLFQPGSAKGVIGQLVRFINKTDKDMKFEQIMSLYPEIEWRQVIKAGEFIEVRLRHKDLWTYKEADHRIYGSIFAVEQ